MYYFSSCETFASFSVLSRRMQISFTVFDNVHILSLSCNAKKPITAKLSKKCRNKSCFYRFYSVLWEVCDYTVTVSNRRSTWIRYQKLKKGDTMLLRSSHFDSWFRAVFSFYEVIAQFMNTICRALKPEVWTKYLVLSQR